MEVNAIMVKLARIPAGLVAVALLLSTGGCVLSSTHQKVLTTLSETKQKLQQTETDLAVSEKAHADLAGRYVLCEAENGRLKKGVATLAGDLGATAARVQMVGSSVVKLETEGADVATMLSQLQGAVAAQGTTIAALARTIAPLTAEIETLRAKLSAVAAGQGVTGGPDPASVASTLSP